MSKRFHISTILTITTGRFVAIDEKTNELDFDLVYQILNYMTSDNLYTHQLPLPRASDECKPYLLDQFPQLVGETGEGVGSESKPGREGSATHAPGVRSGTACSSYGRCVRRSGSSVGNGGGADGWRRLRGSTAIAATSCKKCRNER